jgi:hypothetical protein
MQSGKQQFKRFLPDLQCTGRLVKDQLPAVRDGFNFPAAMSLDGRIETVTKKPPFDGFWRALANQYIDLITIFRNS